MRCPPIRRGRANHKPNEAAGGRFYFMSVFLNQFVWLFVKLPWLRAKNHALHARLDDALKHLVLIAFGILVFWAEYVFFQRFWEVLGRHPLGIPLILPRIVSFTGSFLFAFLAYSSVLTALGALYRSGDMTLLLVTPTPLWMLLLYKWIEIAIRSGATLVALAISPVLAFGGSLELPPAFYGAYAASVLSLAAAAVSLGVTVSMILMNWFPEKRLHQSAAIVGLCLAALLVTGLRFLKLEQLWGDAPGQSPLIDFFADESNNWFQYAPAIFLSKSLMPYVLEQPGGAVWLAAGAAVAAGSIAAALAAGSKLFPRGWRKNQEQADPAVRNESGVPKRPRSLFPLPVSFLSMMQKDWAILRREPAVWTQLFMMIPLAAMYILNLTFLPLDVDELRLFFTVSNVMLIGLIVAALSARYLFPAASLEGRAVWIPASAPVRPSAHLAQKLLFSCPPVLLLGIALVYVSAWIMDLPGALFRWSLVYGFAVSFLLSVLAVALGYCFPVYRHRHLLEVSLGKGAFLYMLLSLILIGTLAYASLRTVYHNPLADLILLDASTGLWLFGWTTITGVCLWLGKRRFEELET